MTLEEAKRQIQELRERFDTAFSASDKKTIATLYYEVLGKEFRPTSCQQCYHDALIEVYAHINKGYGMKEKCNYHLRAGFIISTLPFDNGKIYTNSNLTDDVAERYLMKYPHQKAMFDRYPDTANEVKPKRRKFKTKETE